jgi:membrane-bound lytic murein transglycosylase F
MRLYKAFFYSMVISLLAFFSACADDGKPSLHGVFDHEDSMDVNYDLNNIQAEGELIVLTLYGPDTYFEFRGEDFGNQFKLAQNYAKDIGASARVDICRTQHEMLEKLAKGEGDLIAYDMPVDSLNNEVIFCGQKQLNGFLDSLAIVEQDKSIKTNGKVAWVVRKSSPLLAQRLNKWMADNKDRFFDMSQPQIKQSNQRRSTAYVSNDYFPDIPYFSDYPGNGYNSSRRSSSNNSYSYPQAYSNNNSTFSSKGLISYYDNLFMRYAPSSGMDWRLLAAIAYNESAFNPNATSPMGAMGLMQLMPSTARQYGASNPYDPAQSVRA